MRGVIGELSVQKETLKKQNWFLRWKLDGIKSIVDDYIDDEKNTHTYDTNEKTGIYLSYKTSDEMRRFLFHINAQQKVDYHINFMTNSNSISGI